MKLRNELNARLYSRKMDEARVPDMYGSGIYAHICSGDTVTVARQLENGELMLLSDMRVLSSDSIRNAMYHFVTAAAAVAHVCMDNGMGQTEALTLSELYVQKADECRTEERIKALYSDMCLDYAERMQEIRKSTVISLHIRRCIDYIYENLGADLSVRALAGYADLDPAYLSRLFRQETGISPKSFVKMARTDTAKDLLRYSDLPCSVISSSLGFSTQSRFISVFKAHTGMTPKVYRERYRVLGSDTK